MNEQELGRKVAAVLDERLDQLTPATARRLAAARSAALERARADAAVITAQGHSALLAWARSPRIMAPVLGLVLALLAMFYFQQTQRLQQSVVDNADIDAQVLSDELPVTAYLDQGFEIWLYHQAPASPRH